MIKKMIVPGAIIIVVLVLFFSSIVVIKTGYVGILLTFGSVAEEVKMEGVYFIIPFVQEVKQMDIRVAMIEWMSPEKMITAMSKDLLDIYIQAVVTFHPVPEKGGWILRNLGLDFKNTIVNPLTLNTIKTSMGKYDVSEILQNREQITADIRHALSTQLEQFNIILDFVSLVNVDFRPELKAAIEQKQIAEKKVEIQKFILEKQALEAQEQVKKAEADKQVKLLATEAEEEFNRRISGSITESLIKFKMLLNQEKAIEKWNGEYPQVMTGGGSIPLIQLPQMQELSNTDRLK